MIREFLTVYALCFLIAAVWLAIFYQICLWCADMQISPFLSIPGAIVICGLYFKTAVRAAVRRFG